MYPDHIEKIRSQSFLNCHVEGLDSFVLDDTPGRMVRVFVARKFHPLWQNDLTFKFPMSVGFHSHHCDVKLIPIHGEVYNVVHNNIKVGYPKPLPAFTFNSQIREGKGGFKRLPGAIGYLNLKIEKIQDSVSMRASVLHSIYVPRNTTAAWVVIEGKEDSNYKPFTYSNDDLEELKGKGDL